MKYQFQPHGWWLIPVLSLLGTGVATYLSTDKSTAVRLNALEQQTVAHEKQRTEDNDHMRHVEEKVDKIYDKLLDWEHSK